MYKYFWSTTMGRSGRLITANYFHKDKLSLYLSEKGLILPGESVTIMYRFRHFGGKNGN